MLSTEFPLRLVKHYKPAAGVWQARRGSGHPLAEGQCLIGGPSASEISFSLPDDADNATRLTALLCQRALHLVLTRFEREADLSGIWSQLSGKTLDLIFMRDHDLLCDLDANGALRFSTDVGPALKLSLVEGKAEVGAQSPETLHGLELALALGQYHLFLSTLGHSAHAALHQVLALYSLFSHAEKAHLHQVLESPHLDSGNIFSFFLHKTQRVPADADEVHWRDQQITWLLGQDRIDLPYDRRTALEILHGPAEVDEKRLLLYGTIRAYDRPVEAANINRIATQVRRQGQQLVFGRMSRAFHNQAQLFADAALLQPDPKWRQLADRLDSDPNAQPSLYAAAEELRLFLESEEEVPLIQVEGACERFEDAAIQAHDDALKAFLDQAREQIENHSDELHQPQVPRLAQTGIANAVERRLELVEEVRRSLLAAPKRHAAYVVISQRPSATGSHLLVKINEFEDPYLGKAENLRKLVRLAGDRIYSSPDYHWLEVADHWIEAIPLFIKEEVQTRDGVETARTVIDIAGMEESFREEMADHWAANIRQVLESEFLALGRQLLDTETTGDQTTNPNDQARQIAAAALLCQAAYLERIEAIQRLVEEEEIAPFAAMVQVLIDDGDSPLASLRQQAENLSWLEVSRAHLGQEDFDALVEDLAQRAHLPRRPLPTLHVLTTQSAGMTEGYIRTWLEESMALASVVAAEGLEQEVEERRRFYAKRIDTLGQRVIRELGIWVEVEETSARENIPEDIAVRLVIGRNAEVQRQLACLGVLLEAEEVEGERLAADFNTELEQVEAYLANHSSALVPLALEQVAQRNGDLLEQQVDALEKSQTELSRNQILTQVVQNDDHFRQDLHTYIRFGARHAVLAELDAARPELRLLERLDTYLRRYQRLSKTTARKEIVAEHQLNHLTLQPRHYLQASGGGKRYHLLYTPSRVDLGHRERESVETWSQWVGGADRAAARVGHQIYGLINKSVSTYSSLNEPEVLKTGENASMASHFAFSNALSMMVTAAHHGDIEAMGDQMSRRGDRHIHPAGEGYGGYCVPKDGLFLEFVLTLSQGEKLNQLGVPPQSRAAVQRLGTEVLDRRADFNNDLDWQAWASQQLCDQDGLGEYFSNKQHQSVFQVTRLAHVLQNLGRPILKDPYRVTAGLAARWGVHTMVAGGEHVNRFMPFFKSWLLRQGISEAAQRHPELPIEQDDFVAVLTAEYKPDTQDGRFSVGMRKFEILAGLGAHLLYALDSDGQELALLMHRGFEALEADGKGAAILALLDLDPADAQAKETLRQLFPNHSPPGQIRLVSPTGLSTQDLLNYTSDSQLENLAAEARAQLLGAGFSEGELEANMASFGPRLVQWAHQAPLNTAQKTHLSQKLAGSLHALALEISGPEPNYEYALQGADVLDTGIPHRQLLDLLADPARVCTLMLEGRPNSALVIVDGASGARRRALNRIDVMLWFAAGERQGRQSVYLGIGLGDQTVESWRAAMRRQRRRAQELGQALIDGDGQRAQQLYRTITAEIGDEVREQLAEVEKLGRFGRLRPRDVELSRRLARIGRDRTLESMDFGDFLALGGLFLLNGAPLESIRQYRKDFEATLAKLSGTAVKDPDRPLETLVSPHYRPAIEEFREEKGVESSNKAAEEGPAIALEARSQLEERIAQARALNRRQAARNQVDRQSTSFASAYQAAKSTLGPGNNSVEEEAFGSFLGHTRNALETLAAHIDPEGELGEGFAERLQLLFASPQPDPLNWRDIAGGYEDIGDFGRLSQKVIEQINQRQIDQEEADHRLTQIAMGAELFYILLAIEQTIGFTRQQSGDSLPLWRAIADFFAETINDHSYEYRPWVYDRGIGFAAYKGDSLYQLAVDHHSWLYRYLRHIICTYTEVAQLSAADQDLLLGNFLDNNAIEALGGRGHSPAEKLWRGYGQLREIAFIRNDGFPLPDIFAHFDPALINAQRRVNHLIALPVGRTHYSRALAEGPTLARHLERQGQPGTNIIISRCAQINSEDDRPYVQISDGHFYIDKATYCQALIDYKGLDNQAAQERADAIHPKGIRIAAAFTQPVLVALLYPFHGDPAYHSGQYEACGLPYTVQSLFHTWTTYDKAKYPAIFSPDSGVDTPKEIDWLAAYTQRAPDRATAQAWIENGLPDKTYPGLRSFAAEHRLVMIKDAAESGGRGAAAFVLTRLDGSLDDEQLAAATDFVYLISRKNNVAIQEVVISSPEYWAEEAFVRDFTHRQITEWNSPVERQRRPRTRIYGSHRIILTLADPQAKDLAEKWRISHWITLNSKQLITNVGRGGTLDQFLPDYIRPEHRQPLLDKLSEAGYKVMEAMAAYAQEAETTYHNETDRPIGADLTGLSYGVPRYLMLDFLVAPVFAEAGNLVDIRPPVAATDQAEAVPTFVLQRGEHFFEGTIADWRIVLIEPNIGVGLWDRVALREEVHEAQRAKEEGRPFDWDQVGVNARLVLSDLSRAGAAYLQTLRGPDVFTS